METGSLPAFEILLFVLGTPALLILAAYGVVLWFRKQSRETTRQIGEQIQEHGHRFDQIAEFLHNYDQIDQEPYSAQLDQLQQEANQLHHQMEAFLSTCQGFEAETNASGSNKLQSIINAPVNWYRRWRRSAELRNESDGISARLLEAESHVQRIDNLPWDLALQCRQADKDLAELIDGEQLLQSRGARGKPLVIVHSQIPHLQDDLNKIPAPFYEADQQTLLSSVDHKVTSSVFKILDPIRPDLSRYLSQVREWNTAYQKASSEFNELKQAGANLRQAMLNPPEGLLITSLQERLDQIAQLAANISQGLAQPEVEGLKALAREVTQLRKVVQDTEKQLHQSSLQANELKQVLSELHEGIDKLSSGFAELEHREVFPLAWDESSGLLSDLRRRLQSLGPAQQPRTPEQITQHLKEAQGIRAGHQAHVEAYPKVVDRHRSLVALWETPEIRDGAVWLRKAREILSQAGVYDPRNYAKQDSLPTLPGELEELSKLHESLIPVDPSAPVKESELGQRLKDCQMLSERHKALRVRVENVRVRLEKIQALEKESKDRLTESYTSLERVAILAESNDLLEQLAVPEIDRLSEEIRQLGNELNARGQGEIDKKAQKINAQAEKVNRTLNGWLARLNTEISGQGKLINDRLIQLDTIALLEDPAVADARSVLARDEYISALQVSGQNLPSPAGALRGVAARVTRTSQMNELEATADIKRKNDLWQTLAAVQQALEERTGALMTAYQEAIQARNEAREGVADISKRLTDRRAWPPSNQSPLTEPQVLRPIDEKWDVLKKQPHRVEPAILELGRLTQQYRLAVERTNQLLARVEQDEERVQELEEEIAGLKQRWQSQVQAVPNSPVIREGVQQLMSQADSKLAYIKHQYMRGSLSYEQVIHNLQLLCDELFAARVSVDDQSDIGLNETHHNGSNGSANGRIMNGR